MAKEIVKELLPLIRVYKDGSVERLLSSENVAASPEDPQTGVSSKDIVIADNPYVSARIFLPKSHHTNNKLPIFLYFHGGAFCVESAFSFFVHRYLNILASEANIIAISVDFRLLPHHPIPAAYEDGWTTLQWIASHANNTNNTNPGAMATQPRRLHQSLRNESLPGDLKILGGLLCCPFFWGSKPIGSEAVEGHEQSLAMKVWNFACPDAPGGIDNPWINPCVPGAPSLATLACSKLLVTITGKDEFRDRDILYHHTVEQSGWQDGWTTLQWIASHANNTNTTNPEPWLLNHADFTKVYVGGETSGANIAHNLLLRAGNESLPGDLKILGGLLCCPFFWGSKPIGSEAVEGHEQSLAMKVWNFACPDAPGGIDNPWINPCVPGAPSLATLACSKLLVTITGKDEFRDRDILYHHTVEQSGWQGELQLFDAGDEEHAFQLFKPETHLAKAMIKRLASFLV
ncbi:Putative carboxylesterase 2 [Glycine soja]|uniref:Putative carboxylesterase 2 n=1 Tax=Glycine soja TaxID=3848 RepID=A0A0B2RA81_GLYSO|nr:Putative carboxylesterase 2 [Glycine soja]